MLNLKVKQEPSEYIRFEMLSNSNNKSHIWNTKANIESVCRDVCIYQIQALK